MTGDPPVAPRLADAIRKGFALGLSVGITVLLLRVLFRLSHGQQRWGDGELWGLLGLVALAVGWIAVARPVRRAAGQTPDSPPGDVPGEHDEG